MSKSNTSNESVTKRGIYIQVNGKEIARREYIRHLFQKGLDGHVRAGSRSDIVKYINEYYKDAKVIFQQVYQATSDLESDASTRGRRQIILTLEDGSSVSRREYIKDLYDNKKMSRGEIVKHINTTFEGQAISFQIVYQATS